MQQEVIQKEIEFELRPTKKYRCSDCEKEYSSIEHCKDGKQRCKRCKKKLVTNIFYTPFVKNKTFIGKFNINDAEKKILIRKYISKGLDYGQAIRKVNYDIKCMQTNRCKKYFEDKTKEQNLKLDKEKSKEMKKKFLEGLK